MELIPGLPDDIARECLNRIPYNHFSKASAVCKSWSADINSVQFYQRRKASGLIRPVIVLTQAEVIPNPILGLWKYVNAPVYHLTVYEPETGVRARLPPVPGYRTGVPLFSQVAGVGRYLVLIGGWNPGNFAVSQRVHVYDFISATWKRGADMPGPPRSFFACASSDSDALVFVAGGHDGKKNALRSALAYDVERDVWVQLRDMARERDECKGVVHGGKFHVIGGYPSDKQGWFDGSAEAFDVATWRWEGVVDDVLRSGECPRTCVADEDGNVYSLADGGVAVADSGCARRHVAKVPVDVYVGTFVLMWQGKILVVGSSRYGGVHNCYVLEGGKWRKVEWSEEFRGHVQSGCALQV